MLDEHDYLREMCDEHDYLREMFDYHGFDDIVDKLYQEYLTSLNEEYYVVFESNKKEKKYRFIDEPWNPYYYQ
jgi:hypothetical protein